MTSILIILCSIAAITLLCVTAMVTTALLVGVKAFCWAFGYKDRPEPSNRL